MEFPRVLIVSNNCFSMSGANGRTLSNFFCSWPVDKIAQFYIHNEIPDSNICNNYFRVTDIEALKTFIKGGVCGNIFKSETVRKDSKLDMKRLNSKKVKRNPITFMLRDIVWSSGRWKGKKFKFWIEEFNPEVILIQSGDSTFMLKLAMDLAKNRKIPLIIYNSEGYYFKDKNYLKGSKISSVFYPIIHLRYKKIFSEMINYASHSIYSCDLLKKDYDLIFGLPSTTIMTSSQIELGNYYSSEELPKISYLGNLGVGRHKSLIEIAEVLEEINENITLDIYGKAHEQEIIDEFNNTRGVNYKGLVSYEEVINIMRDSDILIHAENFDEFYQWDLKYAFSTKIADSLRSGRCFLVYAPKNIACTEYLLENKIAYVATHKNELKKILEDLISSEKNRKRYIENAKKISNENHNIKINEYKFQKILFSTVRKE